MSFKIEFLFYENRMNEINNYKIVLKKVSNNILALKL